MSGFENSRLLGIYVVSACCSRAWCSSGGGHGPKERAVFLMILGLKYGFINKQERLWLRFLSRSSLLVILGFPCCTFFFSIFSPLSMCMHTYVVHICCTHWRGGKETGMWTFIVGETHGSVVCMWWQLVATLLFQEPLTSQVKLPLARTGLPEAAL